MDFRHHENASSYNRKGTISFRNIHQINKEWHILWYQSRKVGYGAMTDN
jgi:hypothetical protein